MNGLKALRQRAGLTQEAAAGRLYVERSTVAQWERGASKPSLDRLQPLARLYNVTTDQMIDAILAS